TENYFKINEKLGTKQFLVPYLMSSHPGSDLNCAVELAQFIKSMGYNPEQVQDFYPTPGSLSTTMYYTGIDPLTGEKVYVPKTSDEKAMQRALLQFRDPKNKPLVEKALKIVKREDLLTGVNGLIPSYKSSSRKNDSSTDKRMSKNSSSTDKRTSKNSSSTDKRTGKNSSSTDKRTGKNSNSTDKRTNKNSSSTDKLNNKKSSSTYNKSKNKNQNKQSSVTTKKKNHKG
ncbi:MAG: DUF3362 domain-containing protein, partial [Clostridium sp.]